MDIHGHIPASKKSEKREIGGLESSSQGSVAEVAHNPSTHLLLVRTWSRGHT